MSAPLPTTPQSFAELFAALQACSSIAAQPIGDAQQQVDYASLAGYLRAIDQHLTAQNVLADDCVAFESENTTASLLVLLALLCRGQHLLIVPPQGNPLKEPGFKPAIPAFCNAHLTVSSITADTLSVDKILPLINRYHNTDFSVAAYQRLPMQHQRLLLLRTSGSMGDAKLVCFSHEKLLGNASNCVPRFALTAASRVSIAVPIFHQYGLSAALIPSLLAGAAIDLQANTNLLRFIAHAKRFVPDTVYLNPTLITMLLGRRNSTLTFARTISAGAPLAIPLYADYTARFGPITNLYGSTEMGAVATATPAGDAADSAMQFTPLSGVDMQINPQDSALHCVHPYPFEGYLDSQGQALPTQACPYDTGDVAEPLDNGGFKLLGRQKDSFNRNGFLVRFADVENALLATGEVEQAVVLTSQQETVRGQKLYAFCVPKNLQAEQSINNQTIRQACFTLLPKYAVPDEVILQKTFPLAPSGKIDRQFFQQYISA